MIEFHFTLFLAGFFEFKLLQGKVRRNNETFKLHAKKRKRNVQGLKLLKRVKFQVYSDFETI